MTRLLFLLFILSSYHLTGQSFQYGAGLNANLGYFVFENKAPFEELGLDPVISFNPGISLFAEFQNTEAFQFRLAGQFSRNSIQLSDKQSVIKGYNVAYIFTAIDLNMTAKYLIKGNAGWKYLPNVGFNISFSKYNDTILVGPFASFGEIQLGTFSIEAQSQITPSIQLGMGIRPPFAIFRFPVELNCNFLFSPNDFLDEPMNVGTDSVPLVLQGKYHTLSIGLNFYLRQLKNHS